MTKRIFKYPLEIIDMQPLQLPPDAEFRAFGLDPAGQLCVWIEVDDAAPTIHRTIHMRGTGHPVPLSPGIEYRGVVVQGAYVWHLWF